MPSSAEISEAADTSKPEVINKYTTAASIANEVAEYIISACKPGACLSALCRSGDKMIEEKCEKVYIKKEKGEKIRKGVGFPTAISPNEIGANYSPLPEDSYIIKEQDLLCLELGCHIDGYIAIVGHSFVVGASKDNVVKGRRADVLCAAWMASQVALKAIQSEGVSSTVPQYMSQCVEPYHCKLMASSCLQQTKQHIIETCRTVPTRENPSEPSEPFSFADNEVYILNVIVSTGEGKPRESFYNPSIYKRCVDRTYNLKTHMARHFYNEVMTRFYALPFNVSHVEDERLRRVGLSECRRHGLIEPYQILIERPNEFIAMFRYTVILLSGGTKQITGLPFDQEKFLTSEFQDESTKIYQSLLSSSKLKKKKKKAADIQNTTEPESDKIEPISFE